MKTKKITPLEFMTGDYQQRVVDKKIAVIWGQSPIYKADQFRDKVILYGYRAGHYDEYLGIADPNLSSLVVFEDMTDVKALKQHLMEYVTNAIINTADENLYTLFEQIYGEI